MTTQGRQKTKKKRRANPRERLRQTLRPEQHVVLHRMRRRQRCIETTSSRSLTLSASTGGTQSRSPVTHDENRSNLAGSCRDIRHTYAYIKCLCSSHQRGHMWQSRPTQKEECTCTWSPGYQVPSVKMPICHSWMEGNQQHKKDFCF